ncbi:MAG: alginate export family protein [Planctomycetota bacterium]
MVRNSKDNREGRVLAASAVFAAIVGIGWLSVSNSLAQESTPASKATNEPPRGVDPGEAREVKAEPSAPDDPSTVESPPPPAAKPLPKPKLMNLRYDEDFSYLDGGEGTYQKDFFDPIKNIHVLDDWRVSFGGEARYRIESETNRTFGADERSQDTFGLFRLLLHSDVKYRKLFRFFAQGILTIDEDRDLAERATDENRGDLHQLFVDFRFLGEESPWTLRLGRQELAYGRQRFVGSPDFGNNRKRFDAAKIFSKGEQWDVDFFFFKPVLVQRKQSDRWDEDVDVYGAYVTYKGIPRHGIDVYAMAVDDTGNRRNPNGRSGDADIYSIGSRFWGKTAGFDYETELTDQWGHWAGDRVHSLSWATDGGYTLAEVPWKPRIGSGFDWASGDKNPQDGEVSTFDPLFGAFHDYFGYLDIVGRQNISAVNVNVGAWPIADVLNGTMTFYTFWLNDRDDALYNELKQPIRRDVTGNSGREVGHELDVRFRWQIDPHSFVLAGYSHFWASDFISRTGSSEDVDWFYLHYGIKF